jgi:hypothetical protein
MSSVASFGLAPFGERLNIGEPIVLGGKPTYSLFVVSPTVAIYAEIDKVLETHRTETFLFFATISAAISLSVFFLLRWNTSLRKAVQNRTQELEDANEQLQNQTRCKKNLSI